MTDPGMCAAEDWSGEPCSLKELADVAMEFVPQKNWAALAQADGKRDGLASRVRVCFTCAEYMEETDPTALRVA